MAWYNPFTWFANDQELPEQKSEQNIKALPIQINIGSQAMLKRHVGRLANLYNALERNPEREDVKEEIERRKRAIQISEYDAPMNEQDARDIFSKLGG